MRPVFANNGSVTAGNSSQMSDGAAFLMIVSENYLKKLNIDPVARFVNYSVAGLPPKIMGVGPRKLTSFSKYNDIVGYVFYLM